VRCNGEASGAIIITATSGNSRNFYYYSIDAGAHYQTSNIFPNLKAASYTVIVKDSFNVASAPKIASIAELSKLVVACGGSISCGDTSGTVDATATGGAGFYQYSWRRTDGTIIGNVSSVSGLSAGTYIVTIIDSNRCMDTCSVTLLQQGPSQLKHKIGDSISCGYIFYVDTTLNANHPCATHFLVCAREDQSNSVTWFNSLYTYTITNATTDILFDRANAIKIDSFSMAANICSHYTTDSCTGWYLPSKTELNLIYTNLATKGVGGFANEGYWSSVEDSKRHAAWIVDFYDGKEIQNDKSNKYHVRAVCEVWIKN